jgi:chemotaxis response regulator CheB
LPDLGKYSVATLCSRKQSCHTQAQEIKAHEKESFTGPPTQNSRQRNSPESRWCPVKAAFPIVGIGASAGGLEALEQFLKNVPVGSGMAFVIVQHLDPTRKGVMSELLQRATSMKVVQVKDRTLVRPDCVYVIPPNKDMSLLHGVLHLLAPDGCRAGCGCRLIFSSARWRRTSRSTALG